MGMEAWQAWQHFQQTGRVEDYLEYLKIQRGEMTAEHEVRDGQEDADRDRWRGTSRTEYRGE